MIERAFFFFVIEDCGIESYFGFETRPVSTSAERRLVITPGANYSLPLVPSRELPVRYVTVENAMFQ